MVHGRGSAEASRWPAATVEVAERGCCGAKSPQPPESAAAQASPGVPRNGAMQQEIERALSYVPRVARRYFGCGVEPDELLAAGNLGLGSLPLGDAIEEHGDPRRSTSPPAMAVVPV